MPKLKRIDNMDILSRDVDRLVEFYHGTLGLLPGQIGGRFHRADLESRF